MAINIQGMAPLLQVFDMPASLSFYRDIIGFTVADPTGGEVDWALLRFNGIELMLNTAYEKERRPSCPDPNRIKQHADTALYFGCPDVDGAYTHLRSKGVKVKKPVITHYGFKALTVTDPDGFHLVFHWPAR